MSILFKGLRIINPDGSEESTDYVFDNREFSEKSSSNSSHVNQEINASGWILSPGWIDLRCSMGEPGHEYKESIESLAECLVVSGFSTAVILPNTDPVIQSKGDVDYVLNRSKRYTPEFLIQGAATKDTNGENLTEILDMHHQSGVSIFGEGIKPLANGDRYMKILQYLQKFDGVLFDHAYDPLLAIYGQMHEGECSTMLGMKGFPNLAEDVAIQRNLEIIRYAGGRVHFQTLNTAKGVNLIRQAKAEGLNVTADVSIYQLLFDDGELVDFDPNLKVLPPFRGSADRAALIEGIKDGTIDALVSNHQPEDRDSKFMEFDLANFGMVGLQTFLPALVLLEKELGWSLLIEKITAGPTRILPHELNQSWTIFDPEGDWSYNEKSNKSLSSNSPWYGKELKGLVKYVIQKGELIEVNV
ncbi:dihydroorotase [Algoriphagus ratkowskyi]|uniref:Dihydroorotase n=1 Tax=Algoriphagus ratkowskyi TaxID=57028 RepID=A0A2W7QT47_9BACT|nr:dihydroorotase [Algoriphagus ratkowskyi]PZX51808.1 dihydroorotase [Algoriphagus ratkowskyi]TXD76054.1 dihydroorotase [Algoriphagus ratkowskyi]